MFLFDEFLSEAECDGLRRAHDKHVQELKSQTPILCFDSITTLRKHLKNAKKKVKVSPNDFVEGWCLLLLLLFFNRSSDSSQ